MRQYEHIPRDPALTVAEVADILRCSTDTVRRYMGYGWISPLWNGGRGHPRTRILLSEVSRFLRDGPKSCTHGLMIKRDKGGSWRHHDGIACFEPGPSEPPDNLRT